jgi:hypothetical protein
VIRLIAVEITPRPADHPHQGGEQAEHDGVAIGIQPPLIDRSSSAVVALDDVKALEEVTC